MSAPFIFIVSQMADGRVAITLDNHKGGKALIVVNPTAEAMTYQLNGNWNLVVNGQDAGPDFPIACQGDITVPAFSAVVFVSDSLVQNN